MQLNHSQHLNDEQMVQAVVDAADLPASVRQHLTECRQCLADRNSFELQLQRLGQNAKQFSPQPQRRIILPAAKNRRPMRRLLDWHKWMAAAATVAAVFLIVWATNTVYNPTESENKNVTVELMEAQRLMTEVNTLVDNALPSFYLEISGEKNATYDEEFYQFLIPTLGNSTSTSDRGKKGTSLC